MNCDLNAFWKENYDSIFYFIRKKVLNEADAKDIMQDVVLKVYAFCSVRCGIDNVQAWLYTIAKNAITDFYRKQKRYVLKEQVAETAEEPQRNTYADAASLLMPLINLLPEEYAVPLQMSELQGMKQEQVAEKLNISFGATRTRIHRARNMLKELVEECTISELDAAGHLISFSPRAGCKTFQDSDSRSSSVCNN
jgi:RNA polymerase sigma-70 factor, ECF subfamily